MTTNARKTDAQRLGNGKKAFNVKQVEKMVEEGSTEYTAGAGISISSENAISVDTATIQPKMSAGSGISISAQNEISVDTTTIQEKLTAGTGITIADNVISVSGGNDEWVEVNDIQTEKDIYFDSQTYTPKKDVIIVVDYVFSQSSTTMQSCRMRKEFYYMKNIEVPNTSCTIVGERVNSIVSNCDISFTNINIRTLIDLADNSTGITMTNSSVRLDLTEKTISVFGAGSQAISKVSGSIKIYYKA